MAMALKDKTMPYLKQFLPIAFGTAIFSFGVHYFVIPNELMEGGLTGISLLLHYIFLLPPSATTLVLNVPLFYLGWRHFGSKAMVYTIFGSLSSSFFLWVMEIMIGKGWIIPFATKQDYLLAALYAGFTIGLGLGIVFRFGGTTGGSDILAQLGNKWKGWSVGQVILLIDLIVIGTSLLYIPKEKVLYSLVSVFIGSKMIDYITEGSHSAKAFTIITNEAETVSQAIQKELDRGVTLFPAKGAFSRQEKEVVYCVVYRQEMRRLKELVKSIDPTAFIIINEVHEVLGEGFKVD
ncbi:YitT family protein [Paenibacillus chitinolyticus]|uniref:YitT family protein n=1 Tax=Paenibacillus chitinolyticus TaxID=79263 RepID=UPI0026E4F2E8|nr:YitT family protein [Paenibacillus chitinolyticus]GKS13924.1 membrane protein [Paenibacillus chitinolyticus]